MKAVWIEESGGPEVLKVQDVPDPQPADGEVLVRVKACSINHLDIWVRRGKTFPKPIIPGSDFAGVIEAVGSSVKGVKVGQEVIVFPGFADPGPKRDKGYYPVCPGFGMYGVLRNGGNAELIAVPAENVFEKPSTISWNEASCLSIAFLTAWHMLTDRARTEAGETVLVQSAGSGVGHAAIQFAKNIGANVITTTGGPEKCKKAKDLGADDVIDYNSEDVVSRVKEITKKQGVDVVIDHNGEITWKSSMNSLGAGGRLVICGVTQGKDIQFDLGPFFYKAQSLLGSTMGTLKELKQVIQMAADGNVKPVIDKTFALDDIREAHEYMAGKERFGKVVVEVGS